MILLPKEYDWGSIDNWPSPYLTHICFLVDLDNGVNYNFNARYVNDNWVVNFGLDYQLAQTYVAGHFYAFGLYW